MKASNGQSERLTLAVSPDLRLLELISPGSRAFYRYHARILYYLCLTSVSRFALILARRSGSNRRLGLHSIQSIAASRRERIPHSRGRSRDLARGDLSSVPIFRQFLRVGSYPSLPSYYRDWPHLLLLHPRVPSLPTGHHPLSLSPPPSLTLSPSSSLHFPLYGSVAPITPAAAKCDPLRVMECANYNICWIIGGRSAAPADGAGRHTGYIHAEVAERDNAEGGRGRPLGGWLCGVRSIRARTRVHAHARGQVQARARAGARARHSKHQINHLINFVEVVVVVVMVVAATAAATAAATVVVVNSKRLVGYFTSDVHERRRWRLFIFLFRAFTHLFVPVGGNYAWFAWILAINFRRDTQIDAPTERFPRKNLVPDASRKEINKISRNANENDDSKTKRRNDQMRSISRQCD